MEIDGQDGLASGDLDDYRTAHQLEPMDKKRTVERPARLEPITGRAETENGERLNEPLDSFGLDHRGNIRGDGITDNSFSLESTSDFPLGTVEGLAHVISARSDNQNRTNSGPDSFSVADSSAVEAGNVNEVQNEAEAARRLDRNGANYFHDRHDDSSNFAAGSDMAGQAEIAQSARVDSPAFQAAFDAGNAEVQPDTQNAKNKKSNQSASGSTKTVKERKRNNLTPPTISGHKWKPSGKSGYELYTREASISENGKRSSTGKYKAYYSIEAIRRLNAERKKKAKPRRINRQS